MVATRTASLSRCVLRCFGSRFASSALMPSVQTTIPFTWAMARSHVRANTESLHHTQLRPVNSSSQKLMDGEGSRRVAGIQRGLIQQRGDAFDKSLCGLDGQLRAVSRHMRTGASLV